MKTNRKKIARIELSTTNGGRWTASLVDPAGKAVTAFSTLSGEEATALATIAGRASSLSWEETSFGPQHRPDPSGRLVVQIDTSRIPEE